MPITVNGIGNDVKNVTVDNEYIIEITVDGVVKFRKTAPFSLIVGTSTYTSYSVMVEPLTTAQIFTEFSGSEKPTAGVALDKYGFAYAGNGREISKRMINGELLWVKVFSTFTNTGIQIDNGDYIIGTFNNRVYKSDRHGNQIWMKSMGGDVLSEAIDTNGNIYVTTAYNAGQGLVKIDPTGTTVWEKSFPNDAYQVFIGKNDKIYVKAGDIGYCFDSLGTELWTLDLQVREGETMRTIVADKNENIYVLGYNYLYKFDASRNKLWEVLPSDMLSRMLVTPLGEAYVATHHYSNESEVKKYDTLGNLVYTQLIGMWNLPIALDVTTARISAFPEEWV